MKYNFFVEGMGIGSDVICLGCVQSFVKKLSNDKYVTSLIYSSAKKRFVVDTDCKDRKKLEKSIIKALKKAGEELNKDFKIVDFCQED